MHEIRQGVSVCPNGKIAIDVARDFDPGEAKGLAQDIIRAVHIGEEIQRKHRRSDLKAIVVQPNPLLNALDGDSTLGPMPWEEATWD